MNTLHETIIEEQNYLVEENKQLNQELSKLKEEYVKAIVIKDKVNHINALILRWICGGKNLYRH
jgi:regulator of replication initiation timing